VLVGKNNGSNIPQILNLSWVTMGYVQSPGMALGREFQAHRMLKHLTVVSKLSGFKVQLSQPTGGSKQNQTILLFS
jgi:hypothetical protein